MGFKTTREYKIDPELERLIPPLTAAEQAQLRRSLIESEGALDPIKVWRGTVIDGHNRYRICTELGLPFRVEKMSFRSKAEAKAWMLKFQGARRSTSRDQLLALHLMNGQAPLPENAPHEVEQMRAIIAAGKGPEVISGKLTRRMAWNRVRPKRPKPAGTPAGHELEKRTHQTGPNGETRNTWNKTRLERDQDAPVDLEAMGHHIKGGTVHYAGDGSVPNQWLRFDRDAAAREQATVEAWARHAAVYAGMAMAVPTPRVTTEDLITLYNLGDPHIGLQAWAPETGENFDLQIACRELAKCVELMVAGVEPSKEAVIANLGDFFHAQDNDQRTPGHGNKLDVDGRADKVKDMGYALIRKLIDTALTRHEIVHVVNIPGNHDPAEATGIARWLRAVYENEPRVVVRDANAAIQYMRFGKNLFGWCHGDNAPGRELPGLMAADRAQDWGETEHRYFHCGHIHHKTVDKEHPGCSVEYHNTMAGKDAWHARRYRARQLLQAIQYHREFGEHSRKIVNVGRVRAALQEQDS